MSDTEQMFVSQPRKAFHRRRLGLSARIMDKWTVSRLSFVLIRDLGYGPGTVNHGPGH